MSRTGKTVTSDALASFRLLEERVGRLLGALGQARQDKDEVTEKLRAALKQIQDLEVEIRDLRRDRKTVRTRVQDMIREISELDREALKDEGKRVV